MTRIVQQPNELIGVDFVSKNELERVNSVSRE